MKRRSILTGVTLVIAITVISCFSKTPPQASAPTQVNNPTPRSSFVTVSDGKFILEGRPYYFAGTNFWQGMTPGWYSVYDTDASTIAIIASYANDLKQIKNP